MNLKKLIRQVNRQARERDPFFFDEHGRIDSVGSSEEFLDVPYLTTTLSCIGVEISVQPIGGIDLSDSGFVATTDYENGSCGYGDSQSEAVMYLLLKLPKHIRSWL